MNHTCLLIMYMLVYTNMYMLSIVVNSKCIVYGATGCLKDFYQGRLYQIQWCADLLHSIVVTLPLKQVCHVKKQQGYPGCNLSPKS